MQNAMQINVYLRSLYEKIFGTLYYFLRKYYVETPRSSVYIKQNKIAVRVNCLICKMQIISCNLQTKIEGDLLIGWKASCKTIFKFMEITSI